MGNGGMTRRGFLAAASAGTAVAGVSAAIPSGAVSAGSDRGGFQYTRRLRAEHDVDVFIAGGGPSGVAAALAAKRCGASVFLAEASGMFGGAATAAYVPYFATFTDGVRQVVGGIGDEIRSLVCKRSPKTTRWTPIDMEELKRAYDGLMESSGVEFSFFTSVCDVVSRGDRVQYAVLATKRGLACVRAKVFVDCTGDGDLVAYAGGKYEKGDVDGSLMPATLCSQWCDVDFAHSEHPQGAVAKAIEDGVFSVPDPHIAGFGATGGPGASLAGGNLCHVFGVDPTDERALTKAMIQGRRRMTEYERFLREYVKGCQKARLASTAPYLGVRESRRIVCERTMTIDDFERRAVFEDEIGRYCYPVDLHAAKPDKESFEKFKEEYVRRYRYAKGESYGISYASLVPKGLVNALVAGRCIGADRRMQSSLRVMPCCYITGQAAGTAAAMAAKLGGAVRDVKTSELRARLAADGAYLG